MRFPTLPIWSAKKRSAASAPKVVKDRSQVRVGIPKVLNIWTTHQFWVGFLRNIGIESENIVFSSDTSEEQGREFGKGRGTVDCCYPVKAISGHYGELVFGQKKKIDILLSPMIHSLPSILHGHVVDTVTCTRVMAGPENIKAGFLKERDVFGEAGIVYSSPFVSLGDRHMVVEQLHSSLKDVFNLELEETERAVKAGFEALDAFTDKARKASRDILTWCATNQKPCILVLARPYHMDIGIGHEIEGDLQAHGYPILWLQYLPGDEDLMNWLFEADLQGGTHQESLRHPGRVDVLLQQQHQRNHVGSESRGALPVDHLRGAAFQLRMRHGPADLHADAENCGSDRNTVLQVRRSRFHQARRRHQDSHRDHRPLHAEVREQDHAAEAGVPVAELPAGNSASVRADASVGRSRRDSGHRGCSGAAILRGLVNSATIFDACRYYFAKRRTLKEIGSPITIICTSSPRIRS